MDTQQRTLTKCLTADEERQLALEIEAGVLAQHALDSAEASTGGTHGELSALVRQGELAWQRFFQANIGLVHTIASRWMKQSNPNFEDLVHAGHIGLVEAIMRFDHTLGWRFSTLAWNMISQHIAKEAVGLRSCGSATVSQARRVSEIERLRAEHQTANGYTPDEQELAKILGRSTQSVKRDLRHTRRVDMDPDLIEVDFTTRRRVEVEWLAELPPIERAVLVWNFGIQDGKPKTLTMIAKRLGLSVSATSRIKQRALRHAKGIATDELAA